MKFATKGHNTLLSLALASVLLLPGCVYMVVAGVGAVGGYVVSPDTVEGMTSNSPAAVWETSVDIVSVMGLIQEQSEESGIIIARVAGSKVTITIESLTEEATRLRVKARKAFFPKISVAQDVFVKIMSSMTE